MERFRARMDAYPDGAVTDLGDRSIESRQLQHADLDYVLMVKRSDVEETHQAACQAARSATKGFIVVAKNLWGDGQSLYRGRVGAPIWSRLNQCAHNLTKVLQFYRNESLSERTLMKLRL